MPRFSNYCKYGHLKTGDNLLLRPRHIPSYTDNRGYHHRDHDYTERVCKICLNRQKRDWDARHANREAYYRAKAVEQAIDKKLKIEAAKELS